MRSNATSLAITADERRKRPRIPLVFRIAIVALLGVLPALGTFYLLRLMGF